MREEWVNPQETLTGDFGTESEQSVRSASFDVYAIINGLLNRPFFGRLWIQRKSSLTLLVSNWFEN